MGSLEVTEPHYSPQINVVSLSGHFYLDYCLVEPTPKVVGGELPVAVWRAENDRDLLRTVQKITRRLCRVFLLYYTADSRQKTS